MIYGLESMQVLGPKIWESLPNELESKGSADSIKVAIKRWKPESCKTVFVKLIYRT